MISLAKKGYSRDFDFDFEDKYEFDAPCKDPLDELLFKILRNYGF